jgi:hypothetical protein
MKGPIPLTPDIETKILASIRAGAFPHVAAQAWGVPAEVFDAWIEKAKNKRSKKKFRDFANKVKQAKATARLRAEMEAYDKNPLIWLKSGPGREQPDSPGWAAVVRPQITNDNRTVNLFTSPDFVSFMGTLRQALAPFPEAIKALVDIMDGKKPAAPALPPPPPAPPPCKPIDIQPSQN